jgi:TPR repeat protein
MKRDFSKAKELFEKSLGLDSEDSFANYNLGMILMLGLGEEINIPAAVAYFERSKK